jgi:Bacterial SH3 domain
MLTKDFSETFNAAVKTQDWPLIIVLGESAVAESSANKDILYNLGLAYLKTSKAPMAVSVFLSIPEHQQDAAIVSARDEAMRLAGSSNDDLDMSAHGFMGSLTHLANRIDALDPYTWTVASLGCSIVLGALFAFFRPRLTSWRYQLIPKIVFTASLMLTMVSLVGIGIDYFFQSHWGAVVSTSSAAVRAVPSEKSDVLKELKPGKPVLVLGDVTQPWVRVLDADGGSGWMNALELRVIRETF